MKDETDLEITNTNNRISTNKTRLELINLQLKKNQLNLITKFFQNMML